MELLQASTSGAVRLSATETIIETGTYIYKRTPLLMETRAAFDSKAWAHMTQVRKEVTKHHVSGQTFGHG